MSKNKIKSFLVSISIVFLYFLWPYFTSLFTKILDLNNTTTMYIKFVMNFVLLFMIVLFYKKSLKKDWGNFFELWKKNNKKIIISFLIGLSLFLISKVAIITSFPNTNFDDMTDFADSFSGLPILLIASTLLYYPIIEEIIFKRTFKDLINNKWFFIIVTGLLNASLQVILLANSPLQMVTILPNFAFYASLSYIYYETDNLLIPISLRVFYNLIPNIIQLLFIFR